MPDLEQRFRSLGRTNAPELWPDIESRPPGPLPPSPRGRRIVAGATALVAAVVSFAFVVSTFGDRSPQPPVGETVDPVVVANGKIAYSSGGDIFVMEPDGSGVTNLTRTDDISEFDPAWSQDGSRLAFVGCRDCVTSDLYVMNQDGAGVVRITHDDALDADPVWSPDGSRIVYQSDPSATWTDTEGLISQHEIIRVVNADGTGKRDLTAGPARDIHPAWSPDGTAIAFMRLQGPGGTTSSSIYVSDLAGGEERRTPGSLWAGYPSWSSEGIAFTALDRSTGSTTLYVMDADGSDLRPLTSTGGSWGGATVWSPDGRRIATWARLDHAGIYVVDLEKASAHLVAEVEDVEGLSWQSVVNTEPTPTDVPEVVAVDSIQVAEDVRSVAYGEGSVWVAADDDDGTFPGRIVRIDTATMEVMAEIPVDALPSWEVGGGGLIVADGSVWMTGSANEPGSERGSRAVLIRIDPLTNSIVEQIDLGSGHGADVAMDDHGIWVLMDGAEGTMEVVGVDPASGQVAARIELESTWAHFLVAAGGRLWTNERFGDSVLTIIDPLEGRVVANIPAPEWSDAQSETLTAGDGFVWAGFMNGTMGAIDPSPGTFPVEPIDVPGLQYAATFSGGAIWYLGYDQSAPGSFVARYHPATGETDVVVPLGNDPARVALAVGPGSVWVLGYDGSLTRVTLG